MMERDISIAAFMAMARPGIYTPPGPDPEEVEVSVVVDLAIEVYDGRVIVSRDTADFRLDQVSPEPGGKLSDVEGYDGMEFEITKRETDDGILVTVFMERE